MDTLLGMKQLMDVPVFLVQNAIHDALCTVSIIKVLVMREYW